jgi:hypothetical protein
MTTNTQAMDAVHEGRQVECTLEEYDPGAGIGIRGILHLYAEQHLSVGDVDHYAAAIAEIARLDDVLGWTPSDEE